MFTFIVTVAVDGMCHRVAEIIEITHHIMKCLTGAVNGTQEHGCVPLITQFGRTDDFDLFFMSVTPNYSMTPGYLLYVLAGLLTFDLSLVVVA